MMQWIESDAESWRISGAEWNWYRGAKGSAGFWERKRDAKP
jgi:hypothetical protein